MTFREFSERYLRHDRQLLPWQVELAEKILSGGQPVQFAPPSLPPEVRDRLALLWSLLRDTSTRSSP